MLLSFLCTKAFKLNILVAMFLVVLAREAIRNIELISEVFETLKFSLHQHKVLISDNRKEINQNEQLKKSPN